MFVPLFVAVTLFFTSLLVYGLAMYSVVSVVVKLIRRGQSNLGFWSGSAFMAIVTLIMLAGHLTQIVLWAVAFRLGGQFPSLGAAFYFSAQAYTALGDSGVQLSHQWRLLGPLEAINGLLFFGMSTAVLFSIMRHMIADRLSIETSNPGEASRSESPLPVAGIEDSSLVQAPISDDRGGHSSPKDQAGMGVCSFIALADFKGALE